MTQSHSEFQLKKAVRERTPLLIGLVGASGSGKTYSALRLARGIQKVAGGRIAVIDTEARRALHYADDFDFDHMEFGAPFGPLRYLEAIEFAAKTASVVVVDSTSHEHEGPGGVLEMHEAEMDRLSKAWGTSRDKVNMSAWQKPKSERRRLINALLQMPTNFIFCFRSKEKVKVDKAGKPSPMGWMPIAGEEFIYEMSLNCLLYPGSGGVPSWHPDESGEKAIVKLPGQFVDIFMREFKGQPMSEDIGQRLATWAAGGIGSGKGRNGDPRQPIVKDILRLTGELKMATEERRSWLEQTFGSPDPNKLEVAQLEDARSLLAVWVDQGEDDYKAELATYIELGKVKAAA